MCKELKEDPEFINLLIYIQRYEDMKNLSNHRDFQKRIDNLIQLELMRYYKNTIDRQTKYGHNLKCSK